MQDVQPPLLLDESISTSSAGTSSNKVKMSTAISRFQLVCLKKWLFVNSFRSFICKKVGAQSSRLPNDDHNSRNRGGVSCMHRGGIQQSGDPFLWREHRQTWRWSGIDGCTSDCGWSRFCAVNLKADFIGDRTRKYLKSWYRCTFIE